MMNQPTISRDIQFLQEAAEKIAGLNATSAVNAPIQEGDVSSSNPPILATELFGSALQELQGFLFVVNSQGRIVSVTDNITEYLGYLPSEWPDASIYDFLHVTNHASFSQNILSPLEDGKPRVDKNKVLSHFPCRMRRGTNHTNGTEGRKEETPLVHVQITSLPRRIEHLSPPSISSISGSQMYLICVAQMVNDPVALWTRPARWHSQLAPSPKPISSVKSHTSVDFAMHLNMEWIVLACDFSGIGASDELSSRFVSNKFSQFVHNNDLSPFQKYADSVVKGGTDGHFSTIYRFKLTDTRTVFVRTIAQLKTNHNSNGLQFILTKHFILRDCDSNELKGSASTSLMNAIIQSKNQSSAPAADNTGASYHPSSSQQLASGNYGLNTAKQYQQGQFSSSDNRQLHQPSGGLVQQPSYSLTTTMMSGLPQTPDFNFNDVYPSRMAGNRSNFDVYESGFNWSGGASSQSLQQPTRGHNLLTQQHSLHMSLQTDIGSINSLDSKSGVPTLPSYTTSYQGEVPQLNQSVPNGKLRELLSSASTSNAQQSMSMSSSGSSSSVIASLADSNPVPISPSSTSSSKISDQHHLLKKLLSEEPQTEDSEKPERNGILEKLFKDEDKEASSAVKKSPPTASPGSNSVSSSRRHSSGGSGKDSKARQSEDSGRATKRKISTSTASAALTEPDSTATSANISLLNQLLTLPLNTSSKVDPQEVTATPLEKLKAQRNRAAQSNVIDVVDNKIMHGTEVMDMERFTAMVRPTDSSMYQRQNSTGSTGYPNGSMYSSNQPGHMLNAMDTGMHTQQSDGSMTSNYINHDSKGFFNNNMGGPPTLPSHIPQQQPTSRAIPHSMHFQQTVKSESTDSDFSASMLQQLLNPDADHSIFQELENLLGGSSSMQLTSPEDERAIKNIEKQLLDGTDALCTNKYFPNNPSEPHSPVFSLGLTNVPASASNPVLATAMYNIHHKPQISSSHSYDSTSPSKPQVQHSLRSQLQQQQQGISRGQSLSSIRPIHKQLSRQGSSSGRSMSQSSEGKVRRRSGNSPSGSLSSFSPMGNGPMGQNMQSNYMMAGNFGEMMKSADPPPNVKLLQNLNSNTFPPRSTDVLRQELSSPRTSRGSMDIPSSPQHMRFSDQYSSGPRSMMQRSMMGGPVNSPYHQDQMNILSNQQHMTNSNGLGSPQGMRQIENAGNALPPGGQSNLQSYNHIDQWILNQRISNNPVSNSQYVKQEMKAAIAARAQKQLTSPQHQNFSNQQHVMSSQQMTMMSPPSARQSKMSTDIFSPQYSTPSLHGDRIHDSFQDSVLPDDILDQITELTDTQNEMQQHQMEVMSHSKSLSKENAMITSDSTMAARDNSMVTNEQDIVQQKINQSKKESSEVRNQLRALAAGPSKQPDGTLDKVFRTQLAKSLTSKAKTTPKSSADTVGFEKLKQHSQNTQVNVITVGSRPPVDDMQPNDQKNSILQQLLTDNVTS